MQRPIGIDLFAGAGGMTLGFEQAGFDILVSVELDPIHCATHQFNFPFWPILCRSIVDITGDDIRQLSDIKNKEIDVIFGGPPCQGFSLMGKRTLDDPRNTLISHFVRLVLELKPKYFVIENVKGLTVGKQNFFLEEVIDKLSKNGYQVQQPYQILNAVNYGIPQNRERLFLMGCKKGLILPNYPLAITNISTDKKSENLITVKDAIGDLPEVENYPELLERDWIKVENDYGKPSKYAIKLRNIERFNNDYSYKREYDQTILTSSLRTRHTEKSRERFNATAPGKIESVSHFYRLNPDGICNTLRAGTPSSKGAYTSPRPIHPFTPRCITVREAARLHSYPDWFRFHVTKWHGFRQVGNSVPPLLAKAVAQEIIHVLNIKPLQPRGKKIKLEKWENLEFNMSMAAKKYQVDRHTIAPRSRKKIIS
ncbi:MULTISPECIES: DNA cytosine methyltransferase [Okeania]|uniref:Cytosine-specific methyltransferase n=1 Tax=Okeania hirsuta TaxID=1458930 RepID=A0A3N6P2J1_9CYAN|nr:MULTISPECIES: DNA cytosine methyltransferase [Okeania]NET12716.1 DNA cytosine methyltransferase [Okeania sp. SIO1H6]NES76837.1 DNA cytosine methyltransferase [Okeania sp. SIO1H4]NES91036.1 DNA cytosine methyltransferase [Okeania sp. SIO2B9]NET20466.1 DNA cytosine methyltransferase [Okeania sp. SIO1H5]NET78239.1 DNA cytosine methyltransferase [Okeania sp. SIO1F9]